MKTIFTCLFMSVALFVSAQQNTFKVRSYAADYSYLQQLVQLSDGSFVGVGGIYQDPNTGIINLYLLKTDAGGTVIASQAINSGNSYVYSITKTSDGGFVICGVWDNGADVMKCSANLSIQWQRDYTIGINPVAITKAVQTADGYLLAGALYSLTDNTAAGVLIKTDNQGVQTFAKQYPKLQDGFDDIVATTDGNYAMSGLTGYNVAEDSSFLVKVSPSGNVLWSRYIYASQLGADLYSIKATSDGGIVMAGETQTSAGIAQSLLVKFANDGTTSWSKAISTGNQADNYLYTVTEDADGGYVAGGELDTYQANGDYDTSYGYFVKVSAAGALVWTKTIDASFEGYTEVNSVIATSNGGYAACGEGYFYSDSAQDYFDAGFIYKLDNALHVCNEIPGSAGTIRNAATVAQVTATAADITVSSTATSVAFGAAGIIDNVCKTTGVVPVQLLSFTASLQNKSVSVSWTTANEINTDHFVVERSANGTAFTALQTIAAKGNSSAAQSYNINDLQPLPGTSYYRLMEIDKDGKTMYSSVVPVTVMSNGTIVISPNPVGNNIRVIVQSNTNNNLALQVVDMRGNVLASQTKSVGAGRNEINIPATSLAKGIYILKVMDKASVQTIRFVKE